MFTVFCPDTKERNDWNTTLSFLLGLPTLDRKFLINPLEKGWNRGGAVGEFPEHDQFCFRENETQIGCCLHGLNFFFSEHDSCLFISGWYYSQYWANRCMWTYPLMTIMSIYCIIWIGNQQDTSLNGNSSVNKITLTLVHILCSHAILLTLKLWMCLFANKIKVYKVIHLKMQYAIKSISQDFD